MTTQIVSYSQILGKDQTVKCNCGRPSTPRHCVGCGSCSVYYRKGSSVFKDVPPELIGGLKNITAEARGFVCRKCGIHFNESMDCEAPVFESGSVKSRRVKEQAVLAVNEALEAHGGDRKSLLADMFKNVQAPKDPRIPD
jgi:hypothetical protein